MIPMIATTISNLISENPFSFFISFVLLWKLCRRSVFLAANLRQIAAFLYSINVPLRLYNPLVPKYLSGKANTIVAQITQLWTTRFLTKTDSVACHFLLENKGV